MGGGWGGVKNVAKMTSPFFGSKIMHLLVFFYFKRVATPLGLYGAEWDEHLFIYAVYAFFNHFCYVGGFGDLGDPVVRTLRGVSGDVVTVYGY